MATIISGAVDFNVIPLNSECLYIGRQKLICKFLTTAKGDIKKGRKAALSQNLHSPRKAGLVSLG